MTHLSEVINVPPKRRITIPENHVAVILSKDTAHDVQAMLFLIRKGKRLPAGEKFAIHQIAGDLLLAIVEAENETHEGNRP